MNILLENGDNQFTFPQIGKAVGFEYPTTRNSIEDVSGFQSAVYITSKAGVRRLSWEAIIEDLDTNVILLQRAARPGSLKTIYFTACPGLDLQADIEIDSMIMPYRDQQRRICHIEAVAPDWRFYSQAEHYISTLDTIMIGGMSIPAEIPYSIAVSDSVIETVIENAGSEYTEPRFQIYGPGTEFVITNTTTGESFTITYLLSEGDYIEINTLNGTVKLNGVTDIYSSLTAGLPWRLPPGNNTIDFQASGLDVTTELLIFWRDAYGGI